MFADVVSLNVFVDFILLGELDVFCLSFEFFVYLLFL